MSFHPSRTQQHVINEAMRAPSWGRAPLRAKVALLEALGTEANYTNPAHGDRDSLGALQQRASWGSAASRLNVRQSAERFLQHAIPIAHQFPRAGDLAQAVQRSAFPGRYQTHRGEALGILRGSNGGQLPAGSPAIPGTPVLNTPTGAQQPLLVTPQAPPQPNPTAGVPTPSFSALKNLPLPQGYQPVQSTGGPGPAPVSVQDQLAQIAAAAPTSGTSVSVVGGRPAIPGTPGFAGGGGSGGGIISRRNLGRTDQGVDFSGRGPIPAVGDAVVTRVVPHGGPSGWPGGGFVVLRLKHPPDAAHRFVYVAENISPTVRVGQHVRAGEHVAHALGSYPFVETGWAADANGTTLARATSGYTEGQRTRAGRSFRHYLGF